MRVVSNASPLITLARIGRLNSLQFLYGTVNIPTAVHNEVVVAGANMPGALAVAQAGWIQVTVVQDSLNLARSSFQAGLV